MTFNEMVTWVENWAAGAAARAVYAGAGVTWDESKVEVVGTVGNVKSRIEEIESDLTNPNQ
jgi:hypothetical protein